MYKYIYVCVILQFDLSFCILNVQNSVFYTEKFLKYKQLKLNDGYFLIVWCRFILIPQLEKSPSCLLPLNGSK